MGDRDGASQGRYAADLRSRPGLQLLGRVKQYGREWTPDLMIAFLEDPRGVVPGTKMGISPLRPDQARDVVNYIQSRN